MSRSVADFLVLRQKNECLTEENECLKAQLKKYVGDLAEMSRQYNELGFQSRTTIELLNVTIAQQKDQLFERKEEIDDLTSHKQSDEQMLSSLLEENECLKAEVKEYIHHLLVLIRRVKPSIYAFEQLKSQYQELASRSRLEIEVLNATIAQVKQELLETKRKIDEPKVHSRTVDESKSNRQLTCSLFQRESERTALLKRIEDLQSEISKQQLRIMTT